MKETSLKNTVVLKNLQSNLIEEAIIVFKKNTKVPKFNEKEKIKSERKYPLVEAEEIINSYINKVNNSVDKKNKRYKAYIGICIGIILIQNILVYLR